MRAESKCPLISVIIPTYNRADLLKNSLFSLSNQSISKDLYEVVVVNDGSYDNTEEVCKHYSHLMNITYVYQENSGISAAKNLGIFLSKAPIILFFDDDDVADTELLKEHIAFHINHSDENFACLGYTTWHPDISVTHVMRYITEIGQFLFSYHNIKNGQELDFTYFWGGRTSCKRSFLVKHGVFNQDFRYIIEDIELGFRLSKFGLRVIYNKKARSYMLRPITYEQFCLRCERQGRALELFSRLHLAPVVQNYCMVKDAEQQWNVLQSEIDKIINSVKEIESLLTSETLNVNEKDSLTNMLFELYRISFFAFKLKGIIEARLDLGTYLSNTRETKKISKRDKLIFSEKYRNIQQLINNKKRVLVIDYFLPMFDKASGSLRLLNIIKAMKKLDYYVTFIAMNNDLEEKYRPILEELGIETFITYNFIKNNVFDVEIFSIFLKERDFDYAIIEFWKLAQDWMPFLRKLFRKIKIIVDSVDIHFIREIREAEFLKDEKLMRKALQNKRQEIFTYRNADRVWVVTENDKKAIFDYVRSIPIDIIPNIHQKIDQEKNYEKTENLLFVGNFIHSPNRDAVFYLCKEIFPLIKQELPAVKLFIVGNAPQDDVKALASDDIIVTGYVEDLSPFLKKARVSVAPLRYGAGMKGKIGEALSWGLPVVTTSIGAEGMGLIDGIHVFIADDANQFANRVVALYKDRELWNRLSENGKRHINENFSPEVITKEIEKIFLNGHA